MRMPYRCDRGPLINAWEISGANTNDPCTRYTGVGSARPTTPNAHNLGNVYGYSVSGPDLGRRPLPPHRSTHFVVDAWVSGINSTITKLQASGARVRAGAVHGFMEGLCAGLREGFTIASTSVRSSGWWYLRIYLPRVYHVMGFYFTFINFKTLFVILFLLRGYNVCRFWKSCRGGNLYEVTKIHDLNCGGNYAFLTYYVWLHMYTY